MVLLLDARTKAKIKKCVDYGMHHRFGYEKIRKITAGKLLPAGDDPNRVVAIPRGFRAVFSVDEIKPGIWVRRMSVSTNVGGLYPNTHAIILLLPEFGFVGNIDLETHTAKGLSIGTDEQSEAVIIGEILVEPESATQH